MIEKSKLWLACVISCLVWGNILAEEAKSYVIPVAQEDVRQGAILLNGEWQFRYSSAEKHWDKIQVPGEPAMQGYAIRHDEPFFYRRTFSVPADFKGKTVVLRFDGVYSHAKLYVNGKFAREHFGGFSRWETDITPLVDVGEENEILLEVTDRLDDISYASGYAHHPIGGILRDVTLFALPRGFVYDFHTETDFDEAFRDATLRVAFQAESAMDAEYELLSPDGKTCPLEKAGFTVEAGSNVHDIPVKEPQAWDAEHPNLYTLSVRLSRDGKELGRIERKVGFREVEIQGNRMLVNGKPVKLRGACRHDIHPELGRTTTAELDSLDALLFKRSNMNFVRTSHYPPSERFLDFCDRYGIYVECESAVCFVDTHRQKNYSPGNSQDSALFTPRYLGQLQEMVKSFRSHASILFWSIGNESRYGSNFQASWNWLKAADTMRPVIFSYPGSVEGLRPIYDLLSMHYQDCDGNLYQWGMSVRGFQTDSIPTIFDEWAHPACYTYETLQNDPGIREFWGISIEKMWCGLFEAPGGLGGAIWGYIDETFALPDPKAGDAFWKEFAHTAKPEGFRGNCVGYGEWGIVDVWRREKPEFWATKKAYSPVRLMQTQVDGIAAGERILLPIYNRFDHTDLSELTARYSYNGKETEVRMPVVAPHRKGVLEIPGDAWQAGTSLDVRFYAANGELIDSERISLGEQPVGMPEPPERTSPLEVYETASHFIVQGEDFEIPFSKQTGLIENAASHGLVFIERGPFLNLFVNLNHLSGAEIRKMADHIATSENDWQMSNVFYEKKDGKVNVSLAGSYKDIRVDMQIIISSDRRMRINYQTEGEPNGYLRESGLSFHIGEAADYLSWKRKGLWSCYPDDAMAGNEGKTPLFTSRQSGYGKQPSQSWADDTHDYYYWSDAGANCARPLTRRAKSMKENIYYYTLSATGHGEHKGALSVCSPSASLACRMNTQADGQVVLYVNNRWDYPEIAWGNYCKMLEAVPCSGSIELLF